MSRTWTVKVGSSLLVNRSSGGVNLEYVQQLVADIVELRKQGTDVVLVSSGAVACGMAALELKRRPKKLQQLQAAAAVGQSLLARYYQEAFARHNIAAGQLLLTAEDREHRQRYINARNTLDTLLQMRAVPIVNENDTVATSELKFGDNDCLAAMVADLSRSDTLVILTDCDGLYDCDPRNNTEARLIAHADPEDAELDRMATPGDTELGRGGMYTKLQAARQVARAGIVTLIANGTEPQQLLHLLRGDARCTHLEGVKDREMAASKRWLASGQSNAGTLHLDNGACEGLRDGHSSLLAVGVVRAEGGFIKGDIVQCLDGSGQLVARGRAGCSADELRVAIAENKRTGMAPIIRREHLVWLVG